MLKFNFALFMLILLGCSANNSESNLSTDSIPIVQNSDDSIPKIEPLYCNLDVKVGAERTEEYFSLLKDKKIGIVGNQSSIVGGVHLVDTLSNAGFNIVRVFSPEHGFRGTADAGEKVNNEIDSKTGLQIISLYGKNKKPTQVQLDGIDVLLFDIQDVGVRFYTYISTLHYVMEAAAEKGIEVIVLDRPNPNGHYVDGPVLKDGFSSFIGMHKVPVVHGMTIGEYAQMINGEKWLNGAVSCNLNVIKCVGWDHTKFYSLPIAPSPNLPNMTAVYLYPSLCFFEGTIVSIGRGTDWPFQVVGHPGFKSNLADSNVFEFKPLPNFGAKDPVLNGQTCFGYDLHEMDIRTLQNKGELNLTYLIDFFANVNSKEPFFLTNNFIDLLAGNSTLRKQINDGLSLEEIKASWKSDLDSFQIIRQKYLLY